MTYQTHTQPRPELEALRAISQLGSVLLEMLEAHQHLAPGMSYHAGRLQVMQGLRTACHAIIDFHTPKAQADGTD